MSLGIYIHIPFCQAKCNYCHFISVPYSRTTAERYQSALLQEIKSPGNLRGQEYIDSIYFGGGTPSLIPAEHIEEILAACRDRLFLTEDCEISLEANPGTLTEEKVISYFRSGVNRVSLGAQSFDAGELLCIGRLHAPEMIMDAISQLRENGFENLNLDLMLGLPGQTKETWKKNLDTALSLGIPHISVYMLDLADHCPLQSMVRAGSVVLPEEDMISDMYLETIDYLSRGGYRQYEISNFSYPGFSCRHNLKYWQRDPFHGFGLGSHSFDGNSRYANFSSLTEYVHAVEVGESAVEWREALSTEQSLSESLFLGLRLTQGVDWVKLQEAYGPDCLIQYESGMREQVEKGLAQWTDSTVRLTPSGMLLSNEIFQLFI